MSERAGRGIEASAGQDAEHNLADVYAAIRELWPEQTASSWDQVGLSTGRPEQSVRRVLLAVDACAATVKEAVSGGYDLLFTHHPLLLRGVHSVAADTAKGAMVTDLIEHRVAHIAAHTNADQPARGVSWAIAQALGLQNAVPLDGGDWADDDSAVDSTDKNDAIDSTDADNTQKNEASGIGGFGRIGSLEKPVTLREFAAMLDAILPKTAGGIKVSGDPSKLIQKVALLGGAGDSYLYNPKVLSADVYVTSDLRHHPALEYLDYAAAKKAPALIDVAHWAAESLWLEYAAEDLKNEIPALEITVSKTRTDPWTFRV